MSNDQTHNPALCKGCYCMTKTIEGKCGKCGADKTNDQIETREMTHHLENTHMACSNRLEAEGAKAQCCVCVPHERCNL